MEEVGRYILDLCKDTDYAEVRLEKYLDTGFVLRNGIPEVSGFDQVYGLGVRVLVNGAMGFVATNNLDKDNLKNVVSGAIRIAKHSATKMIRPILFSKEKAEVSSEKIKPKINPEDISGEDKLKLLRELDKNLLDTKINFVSRELTLEHAYKEQLFMNSDGSKIYKSYPRTSFFWLVVMMNSLQGQRI